MLAWVARFTPPRSCVDVEWPQRIPRWHLILWLVMWPPSAFVLLFVFDAALILWAVNALSTLLAGARRAELLVLHERVVAYGLRILAFMVFPGMPVRQLHGPHPVVRVLFPARPRGQVWVATPRRFVAKILGMPIVLSPELVLRIATAVVLLPLLALSVLAAARWWGPVRRPAAWNVRGFADDVAWSMNLR